MDATAIPGDLIGLAEAARLLPSPQPGRRISVRSLRRWIGDGKLQGYRLGGFLAVSRADVLALASPVVRRNPEPAQKVTKAERRAEERFVREQLRDAGLLR